MQETERAPFAAALGVLMKAFRVDLDKADLRAWWEDLRDLPLPAVEQACALLRKSARATDFPSRPGDVRELAEDILRSQADKSRARVLRLEGEQDRGCTNRERMRRLTRHFSRPCGETPTPGCEVCEFMQAHPVARLHLRGSASLGTGDVDWSIPVEGCCAPVTQRDTKPESLAPIAAGPRPVPQVVPRGGEGDWLSELERRQEERRW